MKDINVFPSSIIKRIHTMHLISLDGLSTNSNVYPNMRNLSVDHDITCPLETVYSIYIIMFSVCLSVCLSTLFHEIKDNKRSERSEDRVF